MQNIFLIHLTSFVRRRQIVTFLFVTILRVFFNHQGIKYYLKYSKFVHDIENNDDVLFFDTCSYGNIFEFDVKIVTELMNLSNILIYTASLN